MNHKKDKIELDSEVIQALYRAYNIRKKEGKNLDTGNVLFYLHQEGGLACSLLNKHNISQEKLRLLLKKDEFDEPHDTLEKVIYEAAFFTKQNNKNKITSLYLLHAMTRISKSVAYQIFRKLGIDPNDILKDILRIISIKKNSYYINSQMKNSIELSTVLPIHDWLSNNKKSDEISSNNVSQKKATYYSSKCQVNTNLFDQIKELNKKTIFNNYETKPTVNIREQSKKNIISDNWLIFKLTRNLTKEAKDNKLEPLIGRSKELEQIIHVLYKKRGNNPCLVGSAGVGKTAIIEGLAQYLVANDFDRIILQLDLSKILAGSAWRGSLSEKLSQIKEEVKAANGQLIIFIDEIHRLIGMQGETGDIAQEFKEALARGEFPCIGATTDKEYKKYIESDEALVRRFTKVIIEEPCLDDTLKIVTGSIEHYKNFHKIEFNEDAVKLAVQLADKYISEKHFPDKAFEIIDLAAARVRAQKKEEVTKYEIGAVISVLTGIPVERILENDREKLLNIEQYLGNKIIGHDNIFKEIGEIIRKNSVGLSKRNKPLGSFLFLGPTGVGKTETAKILAEFLFPGNKSFTTFDMSEFSEPYTITRLIGAPPGYVGYGKGGELSEAVRSRPFQLILFDEIEKAHLDIWMLLLQILDEGRLRDSTGKYINFSNCIIVMTSNIGSHLSVKKQTYTGFSIKEESNNDREDLIYEHAKKIIPSELWTRIDAHLYFQPLSMDDLKRICNNILLEIKQNLIKNRGIIFNYDQSIVDFILRDVDPCLGARPLKQSVGKLVESRLADFILQSEKLGDNEIISYIKDEIIEFKINNNYA